MTNRNYNIYKQAGIIVSLFFLSIIISCGKRDKVVAAVNDVELRQSELDYLLNQYDIDDNDSVKTVKFVENWIKTQVYLAEMSQKHPQKEILHSFQADLFRAELGKYQLNNDLSNSLLDSIVTQEQIQAFYDQQGSQFTLQDYIVKALYIKVPKTAKEIEKLKSSFLLKNDKDLAKVNSYAKLYAEDYYFDDSVWIYFSEIAEDIPMQGVNKENLILSRTKTYFDSEHYLYFLNIIDYKLKDSKPPLEFLQEQIKSMILTQRMNELREINEAKWYATMKKNYEIKINI